MQPTPILLVKRGIRSAADSMVSRFFFAYFVGYAPIAALSNPDSVTSRFTEIEGWSSFIVLGAMVLTSLIVVSDIILNGLMPMRWRWISERRAPLYLLGSALQIAPAFQVSKFSYMEFATFYFVIGIAAWGISLALLDIHAAGGGKNCEAVG